MTPPSSTVPASTPWFHTLADPTRPLDADPAISGDPIQRTADPSSTAGTT